VNSEAVSLDNAGDGYPQTFYQDFIAKLADNLGIDDSSTVDAAIRTSLGQIVDQRQSDGKLTEEQADRLKQGISSPGGWWAGFRDGPERSHFLMHRMGSLEELADFFGESPDDLRAELQKGDSLATIAENHGKSRDELERFLTDQFNSDLARMQEQAQARFQEDLDDLIERSWPNKIAPAPSPAVSS